MKLDELRISNFKIFEDTCLELNGKSTVIFGVNGTGKSTILSAINYLFRVWINRINQQQGKSYAAFTADNIHKGKSKLELEGKVLLNQKLMPLHRAYRRPQSGKRQLYSYNRAEYISFVEEFMQQYLQENGCGNDMPIFVNYGTNRSVLDIPLRIRNKHDFSKVSALEYAVENTLDFRAFFEWFRNREDLENEIAREQGRLDYQDSQLRSVKTAIESMLGHAKDLRVKRNPLRMVVTKDKNEIQVDYLSDGEKCTLALLGDIARRLAIANPGRENPLEGEGIVLIDEIELHMHPSWQRRILGVLAKVFPNIQFIVTTHSPQILGEASDRYNIYLLRENEGVVDCIKMNRMDGLDTNMILESFMGTVCRNQEYNELIACANHAIGDSHFDDAEKLIKKIIEYGDENSADVIMLEGYLKRSRLLYEKDNQG